MKRRDFLRGAAATVLAATPAMKAAAMLRDFGAPTVMVTVKWDAKDVVWTTREPAISQGLIFGNTTRGMLAHIDFDDAIAVADGEEMVLTWNVPAS